MVCPPVREIIHSLKLLDYLLIQPDKPWYNYNLICKYNIKKKQLVKFRMALDLHIKENGVVA